MMKSHAADALESAAGAFCLVAVASLGLFIGGGWVSDDFVHITRLSAASSGLQLVRDADGFGFYRPAAQLSLWLEAQVHGLVPAFFRATNVVLHAVICVLAYRMARGLMPPRAAALSTLAFALAPKATTVTVLWISARPELLMSLFALVAVLAWLQWQRTGGWWIGLSIAAYLAALFAKESAALLPLALLTISPPSSHLSPQRRTAAVVAMLLSSLIPIALRIQAGALMPTSHDEHYELDFSLYRMLRSLEIYVPRTLPSPLALVMLVGLPAALWSSGDLRSRLLADRGLRRMMLVAATWFLVFMLPVFPIPARSELYLYLPNLGLCLLAGYLVDVLLTPAPATSIRIALVVYAVSLVGYQIVRHIDARETQRFTHELVRSLETASLPAQASEIVMAARDARSEELMREGVGGYINGVMAIARPEFHLPTRVVYAGDPAGDQDSQSISYSFANGIVTLQSAPRR